MSDLQQVLRMSIEQCIRDHIDQDDDIDNAIVEASREIVKIISQPIDAFPCAGGVQAPQPNATGDRYRGFSIRNECPPIPSRCHDWVAVSDNYDASWEGPEDGWKTSGAVFYGSSRQELIGQIDEYMAEHIQGSLEDCKSVDRHVKARGNRYWVCSARQASAFWRGVLSTGFSSHWCLCSTARSLRLKNRFKKFDLSAGLLRSADCGRHIRRRFNRGKRECLGQKQLK